MALVARTTMDFLNVTIAVCVCFHLISMSHCITLQNIDCDTYPNYVETDNNKTFRFYPCVVQLHRCTGANNPYDLSHKKCTPRQNGIELVDVDVFNFFTGTYSRLKIANHTSCEETCIVDPSVCNKYETFIPDECVCRCNYDHEPDPSPCLPPFQWEQTMCDCTCSIDPSTCGEKKEYKEKECGCFCKLEYQERCARSKKVLDPETCECLEPTIVSALDESEHVPTVSISSMVIVLQSIVIVGLVLTYFYNRKKSYYSYEPINSGEKGGHGGEYCSIGKSYPNYN